MLPCITELINWMTNRRNIKKNLKEPPILTLIYLNKSGAFFGNRWFSWLKHEGALAHRRQGWWCTSPWRQVGWRWLVSTEIPSLWCRSNLLRNWIELRKPVRKWNIWVLWANPHNIGLTFLPKSKASLLTRTIYNLGNMYGTIFTSLDSLTRKLLTLYSVMTRVHHLHDKRKTMLMFWSPF